MPFLRLAGQKPLRPAVQSAARMTMGSQTQSLEGIKKKEAAASLFAQIAQRAERSSRLDYLNL